MTHTTADCYRVSRSAAQDAAREEGESRTVEEPTQRSAKAAGIDIGMRALSYLISGVLLYGALGWLGDHYLGTGFLLPIGIVGGAAFGVYVIIRRYGQLDQPSASAAETPSGVAAKKEGTR